MKSKLIYKNQITPSIIEVDLELAESVNFMPGQYVNVTVGEPFRRPYSVTSYEEKTLKILVGNGNPGKGADFFTKAEIGMIIEISVPMGEFGIKDNTEKSIFIATGSGLAPFITMIKSLNSAPVFLLYRIKNYDEDL
ncbi:FAD-dependent oxidoreductase, partial [Candidatus Dojkabacteria bacterium]|nr:FAD-dependent oxidoreductase [Candidatus Dojkabacteria bacterium]